MSKLLYDPKHWRQRAEETRAKADRYASKSERQGLLKIAAEYEQIADRAEQWRGVPEAEQQDLSPARTKQATP